MKLFTTAIAIVLMFVLACTTNTTEGDYDMSGFGLPGAPGNRKQGWSASGTLIQKNALKNVTLQADFPAAENYTAQFKLSGNLLSKRVEAKVTWSVEGNSVSRIISVADGVSIQGTGQGVRIIAYDASLNTPGPGDVTDYQVSIQVVPGTRGSTSNPPILDRYQGGFIAPAGTATFAVPDDAGIISVAVPVGEFAGGAIPDQAIQVRQEDGTGSLWTQYDPRQYFWMPVLPGVTSIVINNRSVTETIYAKPIFGIDG